MSIPFLISTELWSKWTCPPSIFRTVCYQFREYQDEDLTLASKQYYKNLRSDYMDVQWLLALLNTCRLALFYTDQFWFQQNKGLTLYSIDTRFYVCCSRQHLKTLSQRKKLLLQEFLCHNAFTAFQLKKNVHFFL